MGSGTLCGAANTCTAFDCAPSEAPTFVSIVNAIERRLLG